VFREPVPRPYICCSASADTVDAVQPARLDLSRHLVHLIDNLWAARQQAQYLRAGDLVASSVKPASRASRLVFPSSYSLLHAGLLGRVPDIYIFWTEAQRPTTGIHNNVRKFPSRKKAEEFMAKNSTFEDSQLPSPHESSDIKTDAHPSPRTEQGGEYTFPVSVWQIHFP